MKQTLLWCSEFSSFYSERKLLVYCRPSNDIIDELNKQIESLNGEIESLKQNQQLEVSTLTETMKAEKEKLIAEKTRYIQAFNLCIAL